MPPCFRVQRCSDASPDELSADEVKLLTVFRLLGTEEKAALKRIAESMLGPRTIHSPRLSYRAGESG